MSADHDRPWADAAHINWERLQRRFADAPGRGARWLCNCRDLWDAGDRDGGEYFVECADEAAVDRVVADCPEDSRWKRLMGIFDLGRPLHEQPVMGISRAQWIARRAGAGHAGED